MSTVRIQLRRGTASQWTSANPVVAAGEVGFESDTRKMKVGDGTTAWTSLDYIASDAPAIGEIAQDAINTALVAGTGLDKVYNDGSNTITLDIDSTVATLTGTQTLTNKTLTSPTINTPTGITKSDVGLGNLDNTSDANKPVSTAGQTALDLKANLASPTFTGTPLSTTASPLTNSTQIATTAYTDAAVAAIVNGAPALLNTLNELSVAIGDSVDAQGLAIAIGNKLPLAGGTMTGAIAMGTSKITGLGEPTANGDASTKKYVDDQNTLGETLFTLHVDNTTSVHGITDTANLATKTYADSSTSTHAGLTATHGATGAVVGTTNTQTLTNKTLTSPTINTPSGITKSDVGLDHVDNTSDANKPVSTAGQTALDLKANLASPTFTGTVSGVTKTHVGLGNVDDTSDANKPVSTAGQTALDLKANLASPTFTGTVTLPLSTGGYVATTSGGVISSVATIPNAGLTNSKVTVGTTDINLGSSATTIAGLTSVTSTGFTGALTGNASTVTNGVYTTDTSTVTNTMLAGSIAPSKITGTAIVGTDLGTGVATFLATPSSANFAAAITDETGTGALVFANTPTLVTPNIGAATGTSLVLSGDLTVNGTTTTINSTTVSVDDKNLELGSVATPTDITADGGGITLKGTTDKTFNWVDATDAWTSSEHINLASGKTFIINGTTVLSSTAVGGQTIPASAIVGLTDTQTLTNKTLTSPIISTISNTGTLTLPTSTDTLVGRATTDTLTNKTLTSPSIATPTITGTLTLSASGAVFTDGTQTKEGVPSQTTISAKTANYTLSALTERDSMIEMNAATATTLTVPTNATIAYPVGTSIDVLRVGAGAVDVAAAVGVTINSTPGLKLRAQWSSASLIKRATNTWVLVGDLSA